MSKRSNNEHRKINKQNVLAVLALIAIILVIIFGIKNGNSRIGKNNVGSKKENVQEEVKVPEDSTATIVAIGDTLCHSQVFKDAYDSTTKTYDFSPLFKDVTKYFENKTVAVGNLEATLAGPSHPYTGYPTFNTPEHLAVDLKELGLDIMTTANNHSLDIGYSGLVSSLNYLDEAGLEHTGTARSPRNKIKSYLKI